MAKYDAAIKAIRDEACLLREFVEGLHRGYDAMGFPYSVAPMRSSQIQKQKRDEIADLESAIKLLTEAQEKQNG